MNHRVLLFYKYVTIEDPHAFADMCRQKAQELGMKGRMLVAHEGVNATLEGTIEACEAFIAMLRADARFADLNVKTSDGDGATFPRLLIKVRREIVGTQFPLAEADPRVRTAPRIAPRELHEMYRNNDDFVVVDMRNSYEIASGKFDKTVDPGLRASRDLAKAIVKLEPYKNKKIVTVCTGGIRCEKMSAYLLSHGFTDVQQLEEGIHAYMQQYPGKDFQGTLYTFDDRIVMDFGGEREVIGACHACDATTERYQNCGNDMCHTHLLVCDACAKTHVQVFCSTRCRVQAFVFHARVRARRAWHPYGLALRQWRRRMYKKYLRQVWKFRRAFGMVQVT